ncbi:hypothetical protein GIB67_022163 [Kingdonia uniflora]|uniref:ADF-H domain-containing protein n=1 Tax=Kingdonia uniflora TaxID=39325 RepID=A0A7J7N9M8_9MAGN|nr:hypothetical protein GIB67_022163 [Kingdonia uniflora]
MGGGAFVYASTAFHASPVPHTPHSAPPILLGRRPPRGIFGEKRKARTEAPQCIFLNHDRTRVVSPGTWKYNTSSEIPEPEANAASGFGVHDDCKLRFLELKAKRTYRFIVYKIEDKQKQIVVEKVGGPTDSYDDFAASLPTDECRYAVYDFDFVTAENCQKSKIFFIAWSPDTSRVRSKMIYASSKDRFRRELDGIQNLTMSLEEEEYDGTGDEEGSESDYSKGHVSQLRLISGKKRKNNFEEVVNASIEPHPPLPQNYEARDFWQLTQPDGKGHLSTSVATASIS